MTIFQWPPPSLTFSIAKLSLAFPLSLLFHFYNLPSVIVIFFLPLCFPPPFHTALEVKFPSCCFCHHQFMHFLFADFLLLALPLPVPLGQFIFWRGIVLCWKPVDISDISEWNSKLNKKPIWSRLQAFATGRTCKKLNWGYENKAN